jgi:hypothetical protein
VARIYFSLGGTVSPIVSFWPGVTVAKSDGQYPAMYLKDKTRAGRIVGCGTHMSVYPFVTKKALATSPPRELRP